MIGVYGIRNFPNALSASFLLTVQIVILINNADLDTFINLF